jgi:hypothetical protein
VLSRLSVAVFSAVAFPLGALAQEIRLGGEFQVNTRTSSNQSFPSVALLASGGFVVAWTSAGQDGPHGGVFARRFSAAGAPLASEFQVNTFTIGSQSYPSMAALASGDFVVAWSDDYQDDFFGGVFARRFSSAGVPLASEFQVNTYTPGLQYDPSVAASASGDFVVAWSSQKGGFSSYDVFARRFSSAGGPLGSEFQVNSYTPSVQYRPSVAASASGDFVVAWVSFEQDGFWDGVFARRFSSAGAPLGSEFQVNSYTPDSQHSPSVAAIDGDFVVAWGSQDQVTMVSGVFARRFSSAGAPLTDELQLNTHSDFGKADSSVAVSASGDFVVTWTSDDQDGSSIGVFARRVSRAGAPLASEFQVNTYTSGPQGDPSVAADAEGRFVVAWHAYAAQDGSGIGVFAQRFAFPKTLDLDLDGSAEPLTDGLLLLRYLFGFQGAALTTGAVDLTGCMRCDAAAIEAHLAGFVAAAPLQQEQRLGTEFQVNAYTNSGQAYASVAADGDGDFVVVWESMDGQDGSSYGVFGKRYTNAGVAIATEFQVNTHTTNSQNRPAVARNAAGAFVVVWVSNGQDGSSPGIFGRRFSSAGAGLAAEFQVNSYTTTIQTRPAVAIAGNGGFVVAWESIQDGDAYGVFARRFSGAGDPLGVEFQANTYTFVNQQRPAVSADADGDFAIVWQSGDQDGGTAGIFGRRFSSDGVAQGTEFRSNLYTPNNQVRPSVVLHPGGDFLVAWQSLNQDGSSYGIFARRFSSAGADIATEFQVNAYSTGGQYRPTVTTHAGGDFIVAWGNSGRDGEYYGVFARRLSSTGVPLADEFQVNTYTIGSQSSTAVTGDATHFVIAWHSFFQDSSGNGVFAQRFQSGSIPLDIDGNGGLEPLTDGLLALRYLFGFRGATLTTGAIGGGCTRCDAPSIEAYLQGLAS